jgi:hypothetical protein
VDVGWRLSAHARNKIERAVICWKVQPLSVSEHNINLKRSPGETVIGDEENPALNDKAPDQIIKVGKA